METVKRVVHHIHVKLPLVLKGVGARLFMQEEDWEKWASEQHSFWRRVRMFEESVVIEELLTENFQSLSADDLRLFLLDVALFMLCICKSIDAVSDMASMMHSLDTSRATILIKHLGRCGFLTINKIGGVVEVHDVYMKFAESIRNDPSKHFTTSISWCWKVCLPADLESGRNMLLKEDNSREGKGKLRALVLEVGENCERVDLRGFSDLKAVLLRGSKSLEVLGLAGLCSLAVLRSIDCASFRGIECNDDSLLNVKMYYVEKKNVEKAEESGNYLVESLLKASRTVMDALFRLPLYPLRQVVGFSAFSRMRSLQVVRLEKTGIGRLEGIGGMWPQLRSLTLNEDHLERLELGYLPRLEEFSFGAFISTFFFTPKPKRLLPGKDLMVGCPQLKLVEIRASIFKYEQLGSLPAGTQRLKLYVTELPDFSACIDTLKELFVFGCERVERVTVARSGFPCLRILHLSCCVNLVEVDLGSLPSLRILNVWDCQKLQSLKGFEDSKMLQELSLYKLVELREMSCLGFWRELRQIYMGVNSCVLETLSAHLCDMPKLTGLVIVVDGEYCLNLPYHKKLKNLEMHVVNFDIRGKFCTDQDCPRLVKLEGLQSCSDIDVQIRCSDSGAVIPLKRCGPLSSMLTFTTTGGMCLDLSSFCATSDTSLGLRFVNLSQRQACLRLWGCEVLENMEGVQPLAATLLECILYCLRNLRSLQGIQSLYRLERLDVEKCPQLEEVPSLHALVRLRFLYIIECPKLRSLQGIQSLYRLETLYVKECPQLEEVPSLHALVRLSRLSITNCPKLKAVFGVRRQAHSSDVVGVNVVREK